MRAAQEAARHGASPPSRPEPAEPPAEGQRPAIASRIGRTVMPSRHEIVCHGCGHTFEITGKSSQTVCPKCRVRLKLEDVSVEGPFDLSVENAGTMTVKPEGVIEAGTIVVNNLVVQGAIRGGRIRVTRELRIEAGAEVDWDRVTWRDLAIGPGVHLELSGERARMHHVNLAGDMTAHLDLTGSLRIAATGCLRGSVTAAGLRVEDGGGLLAAVSVGRPEPDSG